MHGLLKGRIQVPRETKRELRLQQMLAEPNPEVSHEIAKLKECAESTKIMVEQVLLPDISTSHHPKLYILKYLNVKMITTNR